jgi:cytochrome c oxidase accessory protein FixG
MFDKDTLIITYDETRGDPRSKLKKGKVLEGNGDCIDCGICVQACPTGIDIRDGLQYQCISCASCVDVCNVVMDKMGYERGLISYTTENSIKGNKTHLFRPRIIVYALLLVSVSLLWTVGILTRVPLEVDVIRDRNALYRETREGLIENVYTIRVINKDTQMHVYNLTATGITGLELKSKATRFSVPETSVISIPVRLVVDPVNLKKPVQTIYFHVVTEDETLEATEKGRFIGPLIR